MRAVKTNKIQGFKSKVYNFLNLYVPQLIPNKSKDILQYGKNNLFPNELIQTIAESGTATICANKVDQFIQADGFVDKTSAATKVNENETADQILSLISSCLSYFQAFALHVRRTPDGKIGSVEYIEFEKLRKRISGGFIYNKNLGTSEYKEAENKVYPEFKKPILSPEELGLQIKTYGPTGEILYVYKKRVGQSIYPIPSYYAGIEDIKTDAELSKFEYETTVNSFLPSSILTIVGEVDNKTKDDRGKTDQDYLDDTLKEFTGAVKDKDGKSGRAKLAVLSAKTKEEVPVLQTFNIKSIMDAASSSTDRVARKVSRLYEVPPFIAGLESATGFNTKILVDQIDLFNKGINSWQRMITSVFEMLYPGKNWTISTFNPISYIPPEVFAKLTDDEIRAIAGYAPIPIPTTETADKTIKGINSLSPLVANKVLESMTVDEIRALVALGPKPEGESLPTSTPTPAPNAN